jgi:hypothetical protein
VTARSCVAVDNAGNALTYDGTSWSSPADIDPGNTPESVSCASTSLCVAVDDAGNALTYDGASWSSPASIDPTHAVAAVSCPTAAFCVAVDDVGHALTFPPPVEITTTSLPPATHDRRYSVALEASGGNPPYRWLAGLPRGLRINRTTGLISGVPRHSGSFVVTVTLLDQKIRIPNRPATQDRVVKSLMLTVS